MDFSWGPGAGLPHPATDPALNLLGDHLFADLDDKTLQCLMGGPSLSALEAGALPAAQESEAGPSCKRPRAAAAAADDDCFASWLGEGSGGECEEGEEGDRKGKRLGKKGKPMSQQALAKATREKARRERLNDCFDELARLCDPSGKMVKTDRVSVVVDAIRVLSQLRAENNQLRQLNKFLEERVGTYERQRAQMMYQQAMMQQQQQLALQQQQQQQAAVAAAAATTAQQPQQPAVALAAAPSGEIQPATLELPATAAVPMAAAAAGPSTAATAAPPAAAAAAAAAQAVPAQVAAAPADPAWLAVPAAPPGALAVPGVPAMPAPGGVMPAAGMMPAGLAMMPLAPPPGMHLDAAAAPLQQAALLGVKQEQLAGLAPGSVQPMLLPVGLPSSLPPGAPPMSWLPAALLDVSQDQKLRPPAA